ncbi:MAG: class I SAM-dependent methyltransferase [Thermodesulfobacteriota bacterium]
MTEWDAGAYHRESTLQSWLAAQSLAALTLSGDERVLDVGCGDGKVTAAIAERLPRGSLLGVDPSHRMIDYAHRHLSASNLVFAVADARALPCRGRFDLVVSFNALHWVPEQERALRSVRDALAPGGRTFLQLVPRGERRALEAVIEEVRSSPRWSRFFAGFRRPFLHLTPDEYAAVASAAGLAVERIDVQARRWDFGSRGAFARFAEATFVEWTRMLPAAQHADFVTDVLDRYAALADGPEDAHAFRFYQMEAVLRRA